MPQLRFSGHPRLHANLGRRFVRDLAMISALLPGSAGRGWAAAHAVHAQEVLGNVIEGGTATPVEGAMVLLFDLERRRGRGVLTAANGFFRMFVPAPGRYRIRVDRIGYENTDTELFEVPVGTSVQQRIDTQVRPIRRAGLEVQSEGRCKMRPA